MDGPDTVYGVDFSGAKQAGKKIWIAEIACGGDPRLVECTPVTERFGIASERAVAHDKLTHFLGGLDESSAVGLDFPFSLPLEVVNAPNWNSFLREFPGLFATPEEFRRRCQSRGSLTMEGKVNHLRKTEQDHGGLCAYGQYLNKQTFYGIRDVIRPLVLSDSIRVPPMQTQDNEHPIVLETYPAGVLDAIMGNTQRENYKEANEESREVRQQNLDAVEDEVGGLEIDTDLRKSLLSDSEADGLDAVLAAVGVYRNVVSTLSLETGNGYNEKEGYIYV